MGDSEPTHQVDTFSGCADDLQTGGILQVVHTRDRLVTWSNSLIVSSWDPRFTTHFWESFQRAIEMHLMMSTAFHPQMDGQSERTI